MEHAQLLTLLDMLALIDRNLTSAHLIHANTNKSYQPNSRVICLNEDNRARRQGSQVPLHIVNPMLNLVLLRRADPDLTAVTADDVEQTRQAILHLDRIPGIDQVLAPDRWPTLAAAWGTNAFRAGVALFHAGVRKNDDDCASDNSDGCGASSGSRTARIGRNGFPSWLIAVTAASHSDAVFGFR